MRSFVLLFIPLTAFSACLPDPLDPFFNESSSEDSEIEEPGSLDAGYDEGGITEDEEESYAHAQFNFNNGLKVTEDTNDLEPEVVDSDDNYQSRYFGTDDLRLFCEDEEGALEPKGYIQVSIDTFEIDASTATEIWKKKIEVPCLGEIDFKYYDLDYGFKYTVKIESLNTEGLPLNTLNGSFTTPQSEIGKVEFELK